MLLTDGHRPPRLQYRSWQPPSLDEVVDELYGLCEHRRKIWAQLEIKVHMRKQKLGELGIQTIKALEREQEDGRAGAVPPLHIENYLRLDAAYRKHADQIRWREAAQRTVYTLRKAVSARRGACSFMQHGIIGIATLVFECLLNMNRNGTYQFHRAAARTRSDAQSDECFGHEAPAQVD